MNYDWEQRLARKTYDSYEYVDPDSKYTFPDSGVLRNKLGLTDAADLSEKEHELVNLRLLELVIAPILVESMADVRKIHKHLFQDVYEWAGKFREVNISKSGKPFMAMQAFDTGQKYMNSLIADFHQNANTKAEMTKSLAEILDNQNYFHPFREGNGRTQREVIRTLALSKGYEAQVRIDDDAMYHLYMDGTVEGDVKKLETLFSNILTPKSKNIQLRK